jgi:hypothetical protein
MRSLSTITWSSTMILLAVSLGCAVGSAVAGGGLPRVDPETMRHVQREITVTTTMPPDAISIGEVQASRGHRSALQPEPTASDVELDLKCASYALGGDGISNICIEKKAGLMNNYWYVLEGRATAWRRQVPGDSRIRGR